MMAGKANTMLEKILIIFFLVVSVGISRAQQVEVIRLPDLEKIISGPPEQNDTTYVLNFWATWCKPCVEELPGFDSLLVLESKNPVKIILVSLDFKEDLEKRV